MWKWQVEWLRWWCCGGDRPRKEEEQDREIEEAVAVILLRSPVVAARSRRVAAGEVRCFLAARSRRWREPTAAGAGSSVVAVVAPQGEASSVR